MLPFPNPGDWINDNISGWILGIANFTADTVKNTFNADSTGIDGTPATADLAVATDVGNIVLILAVPLTIAAIIWQVMRASAEGRMTGILRAVAGGIGMVVLSRIVFWYGPVLIQGFDELTQILIATFQTSPGGITDTLLEALGFYQNADGLWEQYGGISGWKSPTWMGAAAGSSLVGLNPLGFFLIMGLASIILMGMLAFRRWALIIMIGLAPLAFMFLPTEKASKAVALKWAQIVIALLAAKPLAAIIIAVTAKMIASSGDLGIMMFFVSIISFAIAGLAPLIAMKFFGFLGAEMGHAYAQAAGEGALGGGAQKAASMANTVRQLAPRGQGGGNGGGDKAETIQASSTKTETASTVTGEPVSTAALTAAKVAQAGGSAAKSAMSTAADPSSNGNVYTPSAPSTPNMQRHSKPDKADGL